MLLIGEKWKEQNSNLKNHLANTKTYTMSHRLLNQISFSILVFDGKAPTTSAENWSEVPGEFTSAFLDSD